MSCGLGAVILVFILVKPDVAVTSTVESDKLQAELTSMREQAGDLQSRLEKTSARAAKARQESQAVSTEVSQLKKTLSANKQDIAQKKSQASTVKKSISETPIKKSGDVLSDENSGEEEYLLGLKVEGSHIAFLVDVSASMTDEYLIDVIKRKSGADSVKQAGPKWVRTKNIVRWLISRLPKLAQVSVVSYSKEAKFLGGANWHQASNQAGLLKLLKELDTIVPTGATNLHKGLLRIKSLNPKITNLYVITDGLPTAGQSNFSGLNPFSSCSSLLGRSNTISGQCRAKLFRQTIHDTAANFSARVNVILLPLEGDPEATPNYWGWTASTGGLLISPARDWP